MSRILVLNPNSSAAVTAAIAEASAASRHVGAVSVEQIDDGPPVIEDEVQLELASKLVVERINGQRELYDAFVIACHGDPGLDDARRVSRKPVIGIGEASFLVACGLGRRFGLLTLQPSMVARKFRQIEAYGLASRCAAIEPSGVGVLHGVGASVDVGPFVDAGHRALAQGADALVLGCAGMARAAQEIAAAFAVPVVEPISAALAVLRR